MWGWKRKMGTRKRNESGKRWSSEEIRCPNLRKKKTFLLSQQKIYFNKKLKLIYFPISKARATISGESFIPIINAVIREKSINGKRNSLIRNVIQFTCNPCVVFIKSFWYPVSTLSSYYTSFSNKNNSHIFLLPFLCVLYSSKWLNNRKIIIKKTHPRAQHRRANIHNNCFTFPFHRSIFCLQKNKGAHTTQEPFLFRCYYNFLDESSAPWVQCAEHI